MRRQFGDVQRAGDGAVLLGVRVADGVAVAVKGPHVRLMHHLHNLVYLLVLVGLLDFHIGGVPDITEFGWIH